MMPVPRNAPSRFRLPLVAALPVAAVGLVAIVSGIRNSPLSPPLLPGVRPLLPFRWTAQALGLNGLSENARGVVAVLSLALAGVAFLWSLSVAWRGRLSVRLAVGLAVAFHVVAVAMPLLISHDVYQYAIFGRIAGLHHANPFVATPRQYSSDPFFPFVTTTWRDTTFSYGPLFAVISGGAARLLRSPAALVEGFKILSGLASIAMVLLVARISRRLIPHRTAFAVVLVGWNPAVVFQTVASAHLDSLIALAVAAALVVLLAGRSRTQAELGATAVLTLAMLLKFPLAVALVAAVTLSVAGRPRAERLRMLAAHVGTAGLLYGIVAVPFVQRANPTLSAAPLWRVQGFLSSSSFFSFFVGQTTAEGSAVAHALQLLVRVGFALAFLLGFGLLLAGALRRRRLDTAGQGAVWAWALLLFALCSPVLWPWYLVWFLPLAWLLPEPVWRTAVLVAVALTPLVGVTAPDVNGALLRIGVLVVSPALAVVLVSLLKRLGLDAAAAWRTEPSLGLTAQLDRVAQH